MKKLIITMSAALLVALSFTSCKEKGCIDKDADNYCSECKDDGMCTYEGQMVLWFDQSTANALINNGSTSLNYFIEGSLIGSSSTNAYWTGAPNCGQSGSVTIIKDLGKVKGKSYSYSVKDQTGDAIWSGVLNFTANECLALQLEW